VALDVALGARGRVDLLQAAYGHAQGLDGPRPVRIDTVHAHVFVGDAQEGKKAAFDDIHFPVHIRLGQGERRVHRHRALRVGGLETDMHRLARSVAELVGLPVGAGHFKITGPYQSLDNAPQQNVHGKIPTVLI
jgi:hypothetical protein